MALTALTLSVFSLGTSTPEPGWHGAGPSTAHRLGLLGVTTAMLWFLHLRGFTPTRPTSHPGQHGQAAKPCSAVVTHCEMGKSLPLPDPASPEANHYQAGK